MRVTYADGCVPYLRLVFKCYSCHTPMTAHHHSHYVEQVDGTYSEMTYCTSCYMLKFGDYC